MLALVGQLPEDERDGTELKSRSRLVMCLTAVDQSAPEALEESRRVEEWRAVSCNRGFLVTQLHGAGALVAGQRGNTRRSTGSCARRGQKRRSSATTGCWGLSTPTRERHGFGKGCCRTDWRSSELPTSPAPSRSTPVCVTSLRCVRSKSSWPWPRHGSPRRWPAG